MTTLEGWLSKVATANGSQEIFQLLNEFRKGEWTDEECSLMSKTYINVLGKFDKLEFGVESGAASAVASEKKEKSAVDTRAKVEGSASGASSANAILDSKGSVQAGNDALDEAGPAEDEEVWYEKM